MPAAHTPEEINARWAEGFNAGDVPAMVELYEPDAVLVIEPDGSSVSGLDAIESALRWIVGLGGMFTYEHRFWLRNGDLAMGRVDYHMTGGTDPNGNPYEAHGSAAEVARRQPDGTWKYVFDHPFGANQT